MLRNRRGPTWLRATVAAGTIVAGALVVPVVTASPAGSAPPPCGAVYCEFKVRQPGSSGNRRQTPGRAPGGQAPGGALINPFQLAAGLCAGAECPAGGEAPAAAVVTPAQLAIEAVALLPLRPPKIGSAPGAGGSGLVGLPVWLWVGVTEENWGPIQRTATAGALQVTARAQAVRVTWNMGDGHRVVCNGHGTPYTKAAKGTASPDCGYRYLKSSRTKPGKKYTVTATTTWTVNWFVVGGGATGTITQFRQAQTAIQINEAQVVTR